MIRQLDREYDDRGVVLEPSSKDDGRSEVSFDHGFQYKRAAHCPGQFVAQMNYSLICRNSSTRGHNTWSIPSDVRKRGRCGS